MAELSPEQLAAWEAEAEEEERLGRTAAHSAIISEKWHKPRAELVASGRHVVVAQDRDWKKLLEERRRELDRNRAELEADEAEWAATEQEAALEEAEKTAGAAVASRTAGGRVWHPAEVSRERSEASRIHGHLIELGRSSSDPTEFE